MHEQHNLKGQSVEQTFNEIYSMIQHSASARLSIKDKASVASSVLLSIWDNLLNEPEQYQSAFHDYIEANNSIILAKVLDAIGLPVGSNCLFHETAEDILDYWAGAYPDIKREVTKELDLWFPTASVPVRRSGLRYMLLLIRASSDYYTSLLALSPVERVERMCGK